MLCQHGLTHESWLKIWESCFEKAYFKKSNKCKVAMDARTRRIKYTHHLGLKGVARLLLQFVISTIWSTDVAIYGMLLGCFCV